MIEDYRQQQPHQEIAEHDKEGKGKAYLYWTKEVRICEQRFVIAQANEFPFADQIRTLGTYEDSIAEWVDNQWEDDK